MNEHEEIMVLAHEPWAGFAKAFWIVFSLACVYLAMLLFVSFSKLDSPATGHEPAPTHQKEKHSLEKDHHGS